MRSATNNNAKAYVQTGLLDADLYTLKRTITHMKASGLAKADAEFSRLVCQLETADSELEKYVDKRER